MAKVVFHTAVDYSGISISVWLNAVVVNSTPTEITLVSGEYATSVFGEGLGFKPGKGFTGVVSGFTAFQSEDPKFTVSKLSVDLERVMANSSDPVELLKLFFNGKDQIIGSEFGDVLMGFGSKDSLNGGAGDDSLIGGAGRDNLTGGDGADRFVYLERTDATRGAPDLITDLGETDLIDLSRISLGVEGTVIGSYDAVADRTTFRIDLDNDGKADMVIQAMGERTGYIDQFIF
ncbi:MAG: hypothetical protein QE280_16345 [Caulobacter sp.]|nr:hypothetical protein [Caulobacter sp.]